MDKNNPRSLPTDDELDELNEHWRDPGDPDGIIEAEERQRELARRSREGQPMSQQHTRRRRWPRALLVLVLLIAATFGAYWIGNNRASAPVVSSAGQSKETKSAGNQATGVATTKHYDSTLFNIGFDYPQSWKVVDTATKLTVTSPTQMLTMAAGKQVSGHILVTFRPKQSTLADFSGGPASAVLASQKLTYKQPTAIQRAQTYISFLSFSKNQSDSLDAIYVTGDNGYQQGQVIPMADVVKGDPLINVTFVSCATEDCVTGSPTAQSVSTSTWKDAAVSQPLTSLLQSLTLN